MSRYLQSADALQHPHLLQHGLVHMQSLQGRCDQHAFSKDHSTAAYREALNDSLRYLLVISLSEGSAQSEQGMTLVATAGEVPARGSGPLRLLTSAESVAPLQLIGRPALLCDFRQDVKLVQSCGRCF